MNICDAIYTLIQQCKVTVSDYRDNEDIHDMADVSEYHDRLETAVNTVDKWMETAEITKEGIPAVTVRGTYGNLAVDSEGKILHEQSEFDGDEYKNILAFDLSEYRLHYGKLDDEIDILDLGFWYIDIFSVKYEEPAHDWREEVKPKEVNNEN